MKQFMKGLISGLIVISLVGLSIIPALAASYSTKYSTKSNTYYFNSGSYSTKVIYVKYPNSSSPVVTTPTTPSTTPSTPTTPSTTPSTGLAAEESKMVNLVNQARMNQGIQPLSVNQQLTNLARLKSQDMVDNNYFSHTSPTYGSPFEMMKNAGVTYSTAGENIAGTQTTESAHQNLMNSEGHRANILNSKFTEIGVGIASGSVYGNIYTQMFIGR